ncbi:MAG TPA: ATP synthase F1 subunit delta [Williamwhitmania sp.]|nr:ATP synthase F1 subunit delta [Williamwhitmania sp.]
MNQSRLFVKYARALHEYSVDQHAVDVVYNDMVQVYSVLNATPELQELFNSPVIFPTMKSGIVEKIFSGKVSLVTLRFLKFLVEKKREAFLKNILISYFTIYRKSAGIVKVEFSSAVVMDGEERKSIIINLKKLLVGTVEMDFITKPELIGGFTLALNDIMLDASIATKLKRLKNRILEAN